MLPNVLEKMKKKISQLIEKNTGYQNLKQLYLIVHKDSEGKLPFNFTTSVASDMKYALITSIDVEKSFFKYQIILIERRTNISTKYLEMYIVMYCLNT